jgi:hypothetical protein
MKFPCLATYRPLSQQIRFGDTTILRIRRNQIEPVFFSHPAPSDARSLGMVVEGLQAGDELEKSFAIGRFGLTRSPCRVFDCNAPRFD